MKTLTGSLTTAALGVLLVLLVAGCTSAMPVPDIDLRLTVSHSHPTEETKDE